MNVLIPTEPDDTHALLVKFALESMGHSVTLLFTADQPTRLRNSVFIDNDRYQFLGKDNAQAVVENTFDVVWWRRARRPYLPKDAAHPEDYQFVVRENTLFYDSITHNIAENAWWINKKEAANRSNFKLLQLKTACDAGMIIPVTLCSNDPKEIKDFIVRYQEEGVIYKPLCSSFWFEDQRVKVSYTSRVTLADLPSDSVLQLVPGIYQEEINKKYELRVTCFGDYIVAAKINSQAHPDGKIDWRAVPEEALSVEPYILPSEIESGIRRFMHAMDIVFGAFDFIVTHDGRYIFLEVNEQGQFLWLEDYCPELKMLDIFVQFILNQSVHFSWFPGKTMHAIREYDTVIAPLFAENMKNHVYLNGLDSERMH